MTKKEDVRACQDLQLCGWWGHKEDLRPSGLCPSCRGNVYSLSDIISKEEDIVWWKERLEEIAQAVDNKEKWAPRKGSWAEKVV